MILKNASLFIKMSRECLAAAAKLYACAGHVFMRILDAAIKFVLQTEVNTEHCVKWQHY